jgi:hypothetical protein
LTPTGAWRNISAVTAAGTRRLIGACGVLIAVWVVELVLAGRLPFPVRDMMVFGPMLPMLVFGCTALVPREQPAAFGVREGEAFVAPPSAAFGYIVASQMFMLAFFFGRTATESIHVPWLETPTLLMLAIAVAVVIVSAWRGFPMIELRPEGILLRHGLGRRLYPWDALSPSLPVRHAGRLSVVLAIDRPDLVAGMRFGRTQRRPEIGGLYVRVDPHFLGKAIRFYVDHPEERPAIGTQAGYERLLAAQSSRSDVV